MASEGALRKESDMNTINSRVLTSQRKIGRLVIMRAALLFAQGKSALVILVRLTTKIATHVKIAQVTYT